MIYDARNHELKKEDNDFDIILPYLSMTSEFRASRAG